MKMRRILSSMMALLLAASLPLTAFAVEADISLGDVSIGDTQVSHTTSEGLKTEDHGGSVTVKGFSTEHTIRVTTEKKDVTVTLENVNVNTSTSGGAAMSVDRGAGTTVTVELDGTNSLQSGKNSAGLQTSGEGALVIQNNNGDNGTLTANGGKGGAGIGGGAYSDGSNITISGGTVNATGGENASGIGGGVKSDGFDGGNGSNITISGGTVTATGGMGSAGIGGASGGTGSNITISDGNVTANGGADAAGIGGGNYGDGSNITISGGTVDATGGEDGAGIGGGRNADGSNITISGGTVTAIGGDAPDYGDEVVDGGGAGIGGGAYGSGDNIAIKGNAQVTATGQGNAANIGNGNSEEDTEKQKDKVDLSGLSSFGKVNGVSGSNGSNLGEGSSSGSIGGSNGNLNYKTWTAAAADLGGLKVSDNDGNDLSNVVWLKADSELEITAKEDKVLVSGNKADLLQLTVEGVKQINLETNRVNVSVSNEVLNKITGTGGSFQLSTDDTTVNLTATDQNNKKTLDMTLTANKQSGTQAAPDQNSKKPEISIHSQPNTGNNSEGGTLQVSTNAPNATLSLEQKYLQTLQNSEFSKLALAAGNLITTVDSMLAANTAVNGSGSISIGDESVIMNSFEFSAADSSENNKLDDVMNAIKFKMENKAQGGSVMVTEVDAKASLKSASLAVTGSTLQSLIEQDVEETALSVNGKTTGFKNSAMRKYFDDSQMGSAAVINVKHLANGETESWVDKVDEHGNVIVQVDSL